MQKNDILYTKQCIEVGGALFDLMPVAAGSKKGVRPLKSSDPVLLAKLEQSADSINTIDEGMELLSDRKSGERGAKGLFPIGTVNRHIEDGLKRLYTSSQKN